MFASRSGLLAPVLGVLLASPAGISAQEAVPGDTSVVADSAAVGDTLVGELPGELTGVLVDSAAAGRFAVLALPASLNPVASIRWWFRPVPVGTLILESGSSA